MTEPPKKGALISESWLSLGVLTRAELKSALLAVFGFPFVKSDIQHLWEEGLSHQRPPFTPPGLSKEVFRAIVRRRERLISSFDRSFRAFSALDRHSRGFLLLDDIECAMGEVCPAVKISAAEVFAAMDRGRAGRVTFTDFRLFIGEGAL
ncbi:unnamed protein product [Vitrella brassicaformis CCMP3155]|uniref:EF-hand domain-containing protein n=1 Tax=Vitrella brassicaformis (strain CCMP3155) TaxID=1169540 RepID=A0A0G4EVY4_VITBC|nr:unnamed protein product [Vitrella brassicaformis CCMP3155]|eukprot:CEM02257.1 unnamed protein product [Vitrella brassicaformis CCMP3155]